MKIGIIGAGFVGLSFAVVLSKKGFSVILIDNDKIKINKISRKNPPFFEPELAEYLKSSNTITASTNFDLLKNCEIIFITVGTPIGVNGIIDLSYVKKVGKELGGLLLQHNFQPILVLKSTVIPGTSKKIIKIIENHSKKKLGKDFEFVTNPEFLREGKAIQDTNNPHILVIGGNNNQIKQKIVKFYQKVYKQKIPLFLTTYETAELIKYSNNAFLATKISFINQISNICEKIPGANVDDIAKAIGIDPRIGQTYLNAGPGFGGSCLPKDLQALIAYSKKILGIPPLFLAVKRTNEQQMVRIFDHIRQNLTKIKEKKIAVLGLSFKEESDDIRESVSIKLVELLLSNGAKVVVHDPMAIENTRKIFGHKIKYEKNAQSAIDDSDCVVIMTPWNEYKKLENDNFKKMKNKLIIDSRRLLLKKKINAEYVPLGVNLEA